MSIEEGATVRASHQITTTDGERIEQGTIGMVIGYQGQRILVEVDDGDSGERWVYDANPWEVTRVLRSGEFLHNR